MKNKPIQMPTGDLLVNQMRTGSLDAVVAYVSNAVSAADVLDAIAIDIPCALATQPVAVAKDSPRKALAARLVEALKSPESRERFQNEGFRWKGTP
jgi:ABC-type molybdate transport system substrate-binding protein